MATRSVDIAVAIPPLAGRARRAVSLRPEGRPAQDRADQQGHRRGERREIADGAVDRERRETGAGEGAADGRARPPATGAERQQHRETEEQAAQRCEDPAERRARDEPDRQPARALAARAHATAKICHSSGTPLRRLAPRGSKRSPEPETSSLTVLVTSTSPGAACSRTREPMIAAIPPGLPAMTWHSPVCKPARMSMPRPPTASRTASAQRTARAGPSNVA